MKRIALIITTILLGIGAVVSVATEAQAGNGTNNFYLTGHCGDNEPLGVWVALDFTNYDSGANQTYHTSYTRSGPGIFLDGVFVDGYWKTSASEAYITVKGHGSHVLSIKAHDILNGKYGCTASRK